LHLLFFNFKSLLKQIMTKYIALLRGINVGGRRKILMADLRAHFEKLGFSNVITYIQSGNVIFETKKKEDPKKLGQKIADMIDDKYGFDVPVVIRSVQELENAIKINPLMEGAEIKQLYLTFLSDTPSAENLEKANSYDFDPDKFEIIDNHVFMFIGGKSHESKLGIKFFESKLKVKATNRNWKTVNKLLELSK